MWSFDSSHPLADRSDRSDSAARCNGIGLRLGMGGEFTPRWGTQFSVVEGHL